MTYAQQTQIAFEKIRQQGLRFAQMVEIHRPDGFVLAMTSHDRDITVGNRTFQCGLLSSTSASRREVGVEASAIDMKSIIDGDTITIPDLLGQKYVGSEVILRVVDWKYPFIQFYSDRWTIGVVGSDGQGMFHARLESVVGSKLKSNIGGTFGGLITPECRFILGDPLTCKKDISADIYVDVPVLSIGDRAKYDFSADDSVWLDGNRYDDYYRLGEIEWTVGDNEGFINPIIAYTHSTRTVELYRATPRPIQVGDEFTVRPGCDGLPTTCRDKFDNFINYGGLDLYNQGPNNVLDPSRIG